MNIVLFFLGKRRLTFSCAFLLAALGLFFWGTMPRQEDPPIPHRYGVVVALYPGAEAVAVERLLIEPLEEHLAEVDEIDELQSIARVGVGVVRVQLKQTVSATEDAWEEVRKTVAEARYDFPAGVGAPIVRDDIQDEESVVLALTGTTDRLALATAARQLKRRLLSRPEISKILIHGDPGEQITVELDDPQAGRLGIDPPALLAQLRGRGEVLPGGQLQLAGQQVSLRPETEFRSLDDLGATPVLLRSGAALPLAEMAQVRRGLREPVSELMRHDGQAAVAIGLVLRPGLDVVRFGHDLTEHLERLRQDFAPIEIVEVFSNPRVVEARMESLGLSLFSGIVIVALVLMLLMGPRLGWLVAAVVPLVTFAAVAIYGMGGGLLHQVSISALVIALGMLVDNAIVMVESVQWRIDQGQAARQAAIDSVRELAVPLGTATGTTLAAFVPLLLAKGDTADFTRAIPIVLMITLTISYGFALVVTPGLAEWGLRRRRQAAGMGLGAGLLARLADRVAGFAVRRVALVLLITGFAAGVTVWLAPRVEQQFFPPADRELVIVDLELPRGSHISQTARIARQVEAALRERDDVLSVTTFVGRGLPHFYYNVQVRSDSPYLAQLAAVTTDRAAVAKILPWVRALVRCEWPGIGVVASQLEQGPSYGAPIELQLLGEDLVALSRAVERVAAVVREVPGTVDVRHNLGTGVPSLRLAIDDATASRFQTSRGAIAQSLLGRTLGLDAGQYRMEQRPVPIVLRASAGQELGVEQLLDAEVATPLGGVPLAQLAVADLEWRPAALYHHNRQRTVKVMSQLAPGWSYNRVMAELEPRLAELDLEGVELDQAGVNEGSSQANQALLRTLPIGILLLLFFLLLEFNSFRRVAIVLITVPLAAIGVVPGLLLSGQPFGFMALLGLIALLGIVVNNAIVLLDAVERRRSEGVTLDEALAWAVSRRLRPILLTTATTVAGLLPLAFSDLSLWPPLAWTIISGLVAATFWTLLVVPALYKLFFGMGSDRSPQVATALTLAFASLVFLPATEAQAEERARIDLRQAIEQARLRPLVKIDEERARSAEALAQARSRANRYPTVALRGSLEERRQDDLVVDTALGSVRIEPEDHSADLWLEIRQPLMRPAEQFFAVPAAERRAAAAGEVPRRSRQLAMQLASHAWLDGRVIAAEREAVLASIERLSELLRQTEKRVEAGRVLATEARTITLELDVARQDQLRLEREAELTAWRLGQAIGVDGPVLPRLATQIAFHPEPSADEAIQLARRQRADLAQLRLLIDGQRLTGRAIRAERWPELEAVLRQRLTNDESFLLEPERQTLLQLVWTPFASATRAPRLRAAEADRRGLEKRLIEAERGVEVEVRAALAALAVARGERDLGERVALLAEENLKIETRRFRAGRITANDLLLAETRLRDRRSRLAIARLEIARARFQLETALGRDLGCLFDEEPIDEPTEPSAKLIRKSDLSNPRHEDVLQRKEDHV